MIIGPLNPAQLSKPTGYGYRLIEVACKVQQYL